MTKLKPSYLIGGGLTGLALISAVTLVWAVGDSSGSPPRPEPVVAAHPEDQPTDPKATEEDGGENEVIEISAPSLAQAGIVVAPLLPRPAPVMIRAPGEVVNNRFGSGVISPPTTGTVIERRVALGDRVRKGQVLALLYSPEMAEALSQFRVIDQDWRRVSELGREIVSDKRFNEARAAHQQALARLVGFGIPAAQAEQAASRDGTTAGHVPLVAPRDGVVGSDAFDVGELVVPGRTLFTIVDERTAWVEARLSPAQIQGLRVGQTALLRAGEAERPAVLRGIQPAIDPVTRTVSVRFDADNADGRLRSGLFVEIEIAAEDGPPVLALPVGAVLRGADGDWQVFVADGPGRFRPVEVKLVRADAKTAVVEGIAPGTAVVMAGAFFLQSEIAKGGFATHNH